MQFRFLFSSDIILSGTGVSLDDFSITAVTGLNDVNSDQQSLTVRPNPASDVITIDHINMKGSYNVNIYDQAGRCVQKKISTGDNVQLHLSELAAGCYFLEVVNEQSSQRGVFIKE